MRATYRIQLHKDFTFSDVAALAGHLQALGISHLYLSPIMEAAPGSNHGYDVCDFNAVSRERGGEEGLRDLLGKTGDLRVLLDIVPNHMAAAECNPYWKDVLGKGPDSPYWNLFDLKTGADEPIRLPVLGEDEAPEENAHFKRVPWKDIFRHISYRRFFNVTSLVGVRVEKEENFARSHEKLLALMKEFPAIEGLRVDHVDGLADPGAYLARLSQSAGNVWVEKILARREELPEVWQTRGTTGYEFIDFLNCVFVHPEGFRKIEDYWRENVDSRWQDFEDCVLQSKAEILDALFPAELARLAGLSGIGVDFWRAITACLPVYRTYDEAGADYVVKAAEKAQRFFNQEQDISFLLSPRTGKEKRCVTEWRQLSGPAMAKGLEDTAHYRYTPLTALNEVGCAASLAPVDLAAWLRERGEKWPWALNAGSTHDTKRSEDVRARLYALADMPDLWIEFYEAVQRARPVLKPYALYFLCQAILGTWPLDNRIDVDYADRLTEYMHKASREARLDTDWFHVSENFEHSIDSFINEMLADHDFTGLVKSVMKRLAPCGAVNSLAAQAVRILSPGVPDIYQGTEIWDFSLVDPDNRRPVDFGRIAELRASIETQGGRNMLLKRLCAGWKSGAVKLWTTQALLEIREKYLMQAEIPWRVREVDVLGARTENIAAYQAGGLIVACTRYPGMLSPSHENLQIAREAWGDTRIVLPEAAGDFHDLIGDKEVPMAAEIHAGELLSDFPVAVLAVKNSG